MIISAAKLQTAIREKDKKKSSLVRTFRLPGASQLQESAHSNKSASSHNITQTPNSHHNAARSRHRSSSSHGSSHTPSHASVHTPSSHKKQKKKKRKRYGSDSDDEDDSDYDPYS
ncbi:hypothetical protein DPMN_105099 [Dreissena polymorpha]|uniref:Uncharacterized protein n=2 Tax=Dreissena polymorpha TaxID=45954 RepID=A0A9D4K373_DREPO|nr:hypothetical protein DPMN_105099 [Dreissena polymorpha]